MVLLLCLLAHPSHAVAELVLEDDTKEVALGRHLHILEDPSHSFTIKEVSTPSMRNWFVPSRVENPNFGSTTAVYWARLRIENRSQVNSWVLVMKAAMTAYIDFYLVDPDNGNYREYKTGALRPVENRPILDRRYVLPFAVQPGESIDLYIRINAKWIFFPASVMPASAYTEKTYLENILFGCSYGAVLLLLINSLLLWIFLRDRVYLDFACWLASISLLKASLEGFAQLFLWPDCFDFIVISYPFFVILTFFFGLRFAGSFLLVKKHSPVLFWVLLSIQLIWGVMMLILLLVDPLQSNDIIHGFGVISIALLMVIAFRIWRRGFRPALLYLAGWCILFAIAVRELFSLWGSGIDYDAMLWSLNIGTLLPMLFFSSALIFRVMSLQRERQQSQVDALRLAEEHEKIVTEKNIRLNEANQQAQQARQTAEMANLAKSNFLSSISHELRTPLHHIIGFSRILKENLQTEIDEKHVFYINNTLKAGNQLLGMVENILTISNVDLDQLKPSVSEILLDELLETTTAHFREKDLKSKLTVSINVLSGATPHIVFADKEMMKQILFLLFSNAVKFTPDGGDIKLEAEIHPSRFIIRFKDTGIGIAPVHLDKVFEPFFQVRGGIRDKTPGVGLGLTLAKKLVTLQGGSITASSNGLGQGCEMTVIMPQKQQGVSV